MFYSQLRLTLLELNSHPIIEKISNFLWSFEIPKNLPVKITVHWYVQELVNIHQFSYYLADHYSKLSPRQNCSHPSKWSTSPYLILGNCLSIQHSCVYHKITGVYHILRMLCCLRMSIYQSLVKYRGGDAKEYCQWQDKGPIGHWALQTVATGNTHEILSTYKTFVKNSNMNKLQGRLRNRMEDNTKINNIG